MTPEVPEPDRTGGIAEPGAAVRAVLRATSPVAIAVSGGVDSMTLAHLAFADPGIDAVAYHAVSAAVPGAATERVRHHARAAGWDLREIDAGELTDERYLTNPVDRCFWCKTDLYATIRHHTDRTIVSGANLDDLDDYRPGLRAAADHDVRHPFVEAGVDKHGIRAIADLCDLTDLVELPASPCLSSRIETGIRITSGALGAVDAVETWLRSTVAELDDVRCRIRATSVCIEVDPVAVDAVDVVTAAELLDRHGFGHLPVRVEPYRRGSAFLHIAAGAEGSS